MLRSDMCVDEMVDGAVKNNYVKNLEKQSINS